MASMTNDERIALLQALRFDAGRGDGERKNFHIVPEHVRALDPNVVLIVGDRGAGKSKLLEAAVDPSLRMAIERRVHQKGGLGSGRAEWRRGYPLDAYGPDGYGWEQFATHHVGDAMALQELWFAYLVRVLQQDLGAKTPNLSGLFSVPGGNPEQTLQAFKDARSTALAAIDELDLSLAKNDQWRLVAYDELDTLLFTDWNAMRAVVRGLVSFWAAYARRWKRIRAKLFLRTDFYRHHTDVVGADIAKLAANRVDLTWSDKNLYAVLVKHIANKSAELLKYCKRANLQFVHDQALGEIPVIARSEDVRPLIERLVGKYMGAGDKKGQAFTWILDHLRDGNENASPRSLVMLIEQAALIESGSIRATGVNLLSPVSLRNALDKVSDWHVAQASSSEFPWLDGLERRLQRDREVPWARKELEQLLRTDWDADWSKTPGTRPPADSPRDLLDVLVDLGVVRQRTNERFDVTDLFLSGLKLRRRGGVKRR